MSKLPGENKTKISFLVIALCKFGHRKLDISKLLQLGASNLVSLKRIMSKLLCKNKKKNHYIFFESLPFANVYIESLISQKPLQLGAPKLDS